MLNFHSYTDNRLPASDIHVLDAGDMSVSWGCFQVPETLKVSKYSMENKSEPPLLGQNHNPFFLSHFCITGNTKSTLENHKFKIQDAEHSFFSFRKKYPIDLQIMPSKHTKHRFFEFAFSEEYFQKRFLNESVTVNNMAKRMAISSAYWVGRNLHITPSMLVLIQDIINQPYIGNMRNIFLESKVLELYLAQIQMFDNANSKYKTKLSKYDIDCLYAAKELIAGNLDKQLSISDISKQIGINQTKLKAGFKELFRTTVFDYAFNVRMQRAAELLQDSSNSIQEISEWVGYSHPNHFSYAFKRKFGISPSVFARRQKR